MNREKASRRPYRQLGSKLRSVRERQKQSVAEVSGAVEIDNALLEKIELGHERPSEDILMLIISYFDIKEDEAAVLWQLAGYNEEPGQDEAKTTFELNQPVAMLMPVDLRIVYSDMVHVAVNKFGVVMNFMQSGGKGSQPLAISRIGMSKEHAQSVADLLQQSLYPEPNTPKALPGPSEKRAKRRHDNGS